MPSVSENGVYPPPRQMIHTERVLDEVYAERRRQDGKWGPQAMRELPFLVLAEEFGELAQALLEGKLDEARAEAIQVAAVAVAAVEALDGGQVVR